MNKTQLAHEWVKNRPHMSVKTEVIGYVTLNGHESKRYRVTLLSKVRDLQVPAQSQVGYVPGRCLVKMIERMQGRELTLADVEMKCDSTSPNLKTPAMRKT
jgi:hypothetical protein